MAIALYDVTVRSFIQSLGGVSGFLAKGLAHCEAAGVDPQSIVQTRLHPDMLPFSFQVFSVAHHSLGAIEGVKAGAFTPPRPPADLDYAGLQALVAQAAEGLAALTPDEVNALEGGEVVFQGRARTLTFTAEDFLMSFSTPNLHFHAATAYDILRMAGAPLGKGDFMGPLRLKG